MCDNKNMERIGVFGGTFDPVHTEHINLIRSAVKELSLDRLFVTPTFSPPHKEGVYASAEDRGKMLSLALKGVKKAEVSDFELENGGKSYSYITAEHFKSLYPTAELYFIVGGDMLGSFKTWKNPERILAAATLVAAKRQGETYSTDIKEDFYKTFKKDFITIDFNGGDVSSTEIRTKVALGLSVFGLVPEKVAEYIEKEKLYTDEYSDFIKSNLPEKRRIHTAGVVISAVKLAKRLGVSVEKARIAATLHDCAKYLNKEDFKGFVLPEGVPEPVEHAFLGAFVAENVLGIKDKEIIDAIKYHTSGRADMTDIERVVFIADMIERNRVYDGVDRLRAAVEEDFENGFRLCLKEETEHLIKKGQLIYEETLNAFKFYVKGEKK